MRGLLGEMVGVAFGPGNNTGLSRDVLLLDIRWRWGTFENVELVTWNIIESGDRNTEVLR